jgi:HEAT repeat protein
MPTDQPATTEQTFRPTPTARRGHEQIDYLVDLLSDENPGNRWKAAQALGRVQDPAAVDALLRALYDDDWRVQRKAVWALGSIGDPRAITPLRRRYTEVDEVMRELIKDAEELIQSRMYRPE